MPPVPGSSVASDDSRSNRGRDSANDDPSRRHRERSKDKKKIRSKSKSSKRRHRSPSSNSSTSSSSASSRSRSRKRKRKNKRSKKEYRHRKHRSRSRDNYSHDANDDSSASSSVNQRERRQRNKKKRKKRRRRYSESDNSDEGNGSRIRSVQLEDTKYQKSDNADVTKPASTSAPAKSTEQIIVPTIEVKEDTTKPGNAAAAASKGPMTQSQYQELQSQIREVVDPHTGRTRWIRGTGEIIERIVSREEHSRLNAHATLGDGSGYAKDIMRAAMRK